MLVSCLSLSLIPKRLPTDMDSFKLALIVVLCVLGYAKDIEFESCGGKVLSVDVTPCETEPCEIPRGSFITITTTCLSNVNADKLRLTVLGEVEGTEVPFPGLKRNACRGKNLTCPITVDEEITFVQKMDIKKFFPKIQTKAKLWLTTDDDQDMTVCCFTTPVNVV